MKFSKSLFIFSLLFIFSTSASGAWYNPLSWQWKAAPKYSEYDPLSSENCDCFDRADSVSKPKPPKAKNTPKKKASGGGGIGSRSDGPIFMN